MINLYNSFQHQQPALKWQMQNANKALGCQERSKRSVVPWGLIRFAVDKYSIRTWECKFGEAKISCPQQNAARMLRCS